MEFTRLDQLRLLKKLSVASLENDEDQDEYESEGHGEHD